MFKRLGTLVGGLLAAGALLASASVLACVEGEVRGEPINPERDVGALAQGEGTSMQIVGAGWFHAAEIVKTAAKFESNITLTRDDLEVNGKSIMGVMMLAAEFGSTITLRADGPDEDQAVDALAALVASKFRER